jgi:16S rRNA (uracil1498-N3)-methyltransferase
LAKSMHRFFVAPEVIKESGVALPPELVHQLRHVLRMRPGQHILLLDNSGWEYEVALDKVTRGMATGIVVAKRAANNEPSIKLTLFQSLMKRDRFEWVLQKGTELGVNRFVPMVTQRTVGKKSSSVSPQKMARWQRIVTEAAEQSRRGRIPQIGPLTSLREALTDLDESQLALMPWEEETKRTLGQALPDGNMESVAVFVGPEGGFAAEEVEIGRQSGVIPVTLGPRILRSETAATVAVALILHELGEIG